MSSIREQQRLKQHYADFEALKAEVNSLRSRLEAVERAPAIESDIPRPRGRPPKVRNA